MQWSISEWPGFIIQPEKKHKQKSSFILLVINIFAFTSPIFLFWIWDVTGCSGLPLRSLNSISRGNTWALTVGNAFSGQEKTMVYSGKRRRQRDQQSYGEVEWGFSRKHALFPLWTCPFLVEIPAPWLPSPALLFASSAPTFPKPPEVFGGRRMGWKPCSQCSSPESMWDTNKLNPRGSCLSKALMQNRDHHLKTYTDVTGSGNCFFTEGIIHAGGCL